MVYNVENKNKGEVNINERKKPFKPGERKPSPKPREPKPILEHGDFEKRDNPQSDRYKPSFDPKPGDDK